MAQVWKPLLALLAFGCLALLIGVVKPAAAATTSYELTFGASDFTGVGAVPPVSSVLGQFAFSLDPAHDSTGSAALKFVNLPHGPVGYIYTASNGLLMLGGTISGVNVAISGTDDLLLQVATLNSVPTFSLFGYAEVAFPGTVFPAGNGSIHVDVVAAPPVAATPIPGALPLFVSAIGGLGLLGWRRRNAGA